MHDILEPRHHIIDYVESASADPQAMCDFFESTLGWSFECFGPDCIAFHGAGLEGGIYCADMASRSADRGALIVFYSCDFEASEALVLSHGASIIKPVFDFAGGRRFQFAEPTGNEFAFWSKV
jgi:predicted enzyme related to lactoylglutathione lyase